MLEVHLKFLHVLHFTNASYYIYNVTTHVGPGKEYLKLVGSAGPSVEPWKDFSILLSLFEKDGMDEVHLTNTKNPFYV